ncbi:hypothetical protein P5673_007999 [Acropora cervicornis]|uniref:Uncharacterized protein n=1 Tax=Acropora cervicornis TaxID=6130 RepID=A0AAD9QVE1_ACRCE|nr:hypothetical protein P5673_007999 [Acropora cervicornis]
MLYTLGKLVQKEPLTEEISCYFDLEEAFNGHFIIFFFAHFNLQVKRVENLFGRFTSQFSQQPTVHRQMTVRENCIVDPGVGNIARVKGPDREGIKRYIHYTRTSGWINAHKLQAIEDFPATCWYTASASWTCRLVQFILINQTLSVDVIILHARLTFQVAFVVFNLHISGFTFRRVRAEFRNSMVCRARLWLWTPLRSCSEFLLSFGGCSTVATSAEEKGRATLLAPGNECCPRDTLDPIPPTEALLLLLTATADFIGPFLFRVSTIAVGRSTSALSSESKSKELLEDLRSRPDSIASV